nr:receptor-type tyrosine-protein phosphatase eta-like [Misgurnus anguillicaudatus]
MRILWLTLLLGSVWAEEQHFQHFDNLTWDEARQHCQVCYKELTTIASWNVRGVVHNLTSDYWVGLRRSLNGTSPWSSWSNGDPVAFQNWYPGHPVPKEETCSLTPTSTPANVSASTPTTVSASTPMHSTTAPQMNNTVDRCSLLTEMLSCLNMTYSDLRNVTGTTVTTMTTTPHALYTSPPPVNITSNSTQGTCNTKAPEYIEDACVALLRNGMWKEKQCYERLPFICYDERFFGEIHVSNVTDKKANLSWSEGPGNISHYRVEVTEGTNQTFDVTGLVTELGGLTAGTQYNVQVFPVKCDRDLNPQNISFYTPPFSVYNLTVTKVTTQVIELSWSHTGNCTFFLIRVSDETSKQENAQKSKIENLQPGKKYNFTVTAVVNDTESEPNSTSAYTKPSRVLNLTSADTDFKVINASWTKPDGECSGYLVCLNEDSGCINCSECINCVGCINCSECASCNEYANCSITAEKHKEFTDKTPGKKYFLCAAALTDSNKIAGEMTQIEAYTRPNSVELSLIPFSKYINAHWTLDGGYKDFNVSIIGGNYNKSYITNNTNYNFTELRAAVYYTITVVTLSEKPDLRSDPVNQSVFTKPTSPGPATTIVHNKSAITVTWKVPIESEGFSDITYEVTFESPYWNHRDSINVTQNKVTFTNLRSGVNYNFNVSVVAGDLKSYPSCVSNQTEPDKKIVSFMMMCSSSVPLHCNNFPTRNQTLDKLKNHFKSNLSSVYWKLKMINSN